MQTKRAIQCMHISSEFLSCPNRIAGMKVKVELTNRIDEKENFFLNIVDQSSHLTPGLLIAFAAGSFLFNAANTRKKASVLLRIIREVLLIMRSGG